MFAYCLNNPVGYCDNEGRSSTSSIKGYIGQDFANICFLEGGCAGGAIVGGLVLTGQLIDTFGRIWDDICKFFSPKSKKINWDCGDNNIIHILKGTHRKHVPGWRRFGIDPDNGNNYENWILVLKILQEVVDDADYSYPGTNRDGSICTYYVKVFVEEGVKVVVKIWNSLDGTIQQIADAIPYILN